MLLTCSTCFHPFLLCLLLCTKFLVCENLPGNKPDSDSELNSFLLVSTLMHLIIYISVSCYWINKWLTWTKLPHFLVSIWSLQWRHQIISSWGPRSLSVKLKSCLQVRLCGEAVCGTWLTPWINSCAAFQWHSALTRIYRRHRRLWRWEEKLTGAQQRSRRTDG